MKKNILLNKRTVFLCLFLSLANFMAAHAPDQSYTILRIYQDAIGGRFEITTKDLNQALSLNIARGVTVEDLAAYLPQIQEYVLGRVAFSSVLGEYPVRFSETTLYDGGVLGDYVQLHFGLDGVIRVPEALDIKNEVMLERGSVHRGLLAVEYNWKAGIHNNDEIVSMRFSPGNSQQTLSLSEASIWKGFMAMIESGMFHIFIGLDHILFLLALLLPSVVRRFSAGTDSPVSAGTAATTVWKPVARFKPALLYVLKVITFFTIAHSVTLSLAALQIVVLPSRIVESIIALSIALAALHNIYPLFKYSDWVIVFGFGLFHGFGFASVLGEVGLTGEYMTLSLLGFNLGVEAGQILIIAMIFPILYFIRNLKAYPKLLSFGSILLILISLYWFTERFFEVTLPYSHYVNNGYERCLQILGLL